MYVPRWLEKKRVQRKADVVVVGAGPSGSFAALTAAKMGVKVVVCEEHKEVGLPSHCAGHISINGLKRLGLHLPRNALENEIKGAVFYSPSGHEFRVRLASPVIYVINRVMFDKHLAQLAEEAGAELLLGTRAASLLLDDGFVQGISVKSGEKLASKIVIDAEGCASTLLKQLSLPTFDKSLAVNAVNCEVDHVDDVEDDTVEIFLGQRYAPGLFAWIIPKRNGSAKVGLATRIGNPKEYFKRFLNVHPVASEKLKSSVVKTASYHLIPLGGPIPKTYYSGFLAVGDAASQVKPTTGGGVVMGLTCSEIAGETAYQALQQNDFSENFLARYQHRWQQIVGFDMAVMRQMRLMLNRLSDQKLDRIISLCSQWRLNDCIQKVKDIDFQGRALLPMLKSPNTWVAVFYSFLASII